MLSDPDVCFDCFCFFLGRQIDSNSKIATISNKICSLVYSKLNPSSFSNKFSRKLLGAKFFGFGLCIVEDACWSCLPCGSVYVKMGIGSI